MLGTSIPRSGRRFAHRSQRPLAQLAAALVLAALLPAGADALDAGAANAATVDPSANALLRQAVDNQDVLPKSGYFTWMDRVENAHGSVTKRMMTTPEGILSSTAAINDRELTPKERRADDARIQRLLDPEEMRKKARQQQQVLQRIEHLLRALPEALDCSYDTVITSNIPARPLAFLTCSPRPGFSPPNRESQVLTGMNASITIDRSETRMTNFEGTLVEDVRFAWGILGKLNRGGRLELRQEKLEGGQWFVTRMELRVDGRLLMVKPLHIDRRETAWDFRSVPAMSVVQALDFLRHSPNDTERATR